MEKRSEDWKEERFACAVREAQRRRSALVRTEVKMAVLENRGKTRDGLNILNGLDGKKNGFTI